jgi:NADH-quinone oxidoreductase subunit L
LTVFNFPLLVWLIPLPPLVAFTLIVLLLNRSKRTSHWTALIGAGLSFLGAMVIVIKAIRTSTLAENPIGSTFNWLPTGSTWLKIGTVVDPLTAIMLFFVAWTVLMIFIYSIGYHNYSQPKGANDRPGLPPQGAEIVEHGHQHRVPSIEPMYSRFFALISLFAFAMYLLVISDNLLTLYIGWEVMGLCSYLLIGFWYAKDSARKAAVKAFITTRIGDVFLLLGIAALYSLTGTLNFREIFANPAIMKGLTETISPVFDLSWAGLIGLLVFIGTVGKSAQFPLHVWLPDAMEGPTPVSAMIHAATMVSAGVYLSIRFFPLISAGWHPGEALTPTMTVLAVIGAFTALFAATIAVAQNDIKRVLAYSTISQLGYMIAALGIGAYTAAAFHLFTHAFFKALLFLGSGSVIHGMEHGSLHTGEHIDAQDMHNMGGLRRKMPVTFWTFVAGALALSGFPLITAGFWSKDEILSGAFNSAQMVIFVTLAVSALLTAIYTSRQITLVFLGEPRTESAKHASENKPVMTIPLVVLAFFAITAGWIGIPQAFPVFGKLSAGWLQGFLGSMLPFEAEVEGHSLIPLATSVTVSLGGLLIGWLIYRRYKESRQVDPLQRGLGPVFNLLQHKYWVDEFYALVIIRPVTWFAEKVSYEFIDKKIIDGFLHAIGRFGLWLGKLFRFGFDLPVVNGAGDGVASGAKGSGTLFSRLQNGKVQHYMGLAVLFLVITGMIVIYLASAF